MLKIYSIRNVNYSFLALAVNFKTQPEWITDDSDGDRYMRGMRGRLEGELR